MNSTSLERRQSNSHLVEVRAHSFTFTLKLGCETKAIHVAPENSCEESSSLDIRRFEGVDTSKIARKEIVFEVVLDVSGDCIGTGFAC